jgi:hypothetical protein
VRDFPFNFAWVSNGTVQLWDGYDALAGEGTQIEPDLDMAAKPAPDEEVDQRVSW